MNKHRPTGNAIADADEITYDTARPLVRSVLALVGSELRLVLREPLVLAFVFAFPIVTVLVIAGSFDADDDGFGGVVPSQWYVASYLAVVIAAIGLVMVPVHLAAYRERGVLLRFTAAGFPRWSFAVTQLVVGMVMTVVASVVLLSVAAPVYGLPPLHDPLAVVAAVLLGALAFTAIGLLIGSLAPNARGAGTRAAGVLPRLPPRRGRTAAAGDERRHASGVGLHPADPRDHRDPRTVARHRLRRGKPVGRDRGAGRRAGGLQSVGPAVSESQQHVQQHRQQDREQHRGDDHGQASGSATEKLDFAPADTHARPIPGRVHVKPAQEPVTHVPLVRRRGRG
jgi:hypothetical protein